MSKDRFSADITAFMEKAKGNADLVARKVALDVSKEIIMTTPVDTGRCRAAWSPNIDASGPAVNVTGIDTNKASGKMKARLAQKGTGIDSTASNVSIGRVTNMLSMFNFGKAFHLTNNVEYAVKLEYGHSKQAPAGMVRKAVAKFQAFVARAARAL